MLKRLCVLVPLLATLHGCDWFGSKSGMVSPQFAQGVSQRAVMIAALSALSPPIPPNAVIDLDAAKRFEGHDPEPIEFVRSIASGAGRPVLRGVNALECRPQCVPLIRLEPARFTSPSDADVTITWISARHAGRSSYSGRTMTLRMRRDEDRWAVTDTITNEGFFLGGAR